MVSLFSFVLTFGEQHAPQKKYLGEWHSPMFSLDYITGSDTDFMLWSYVQLLTCHCYNLLHGCCFVSVCTGTKFGLRRTGHAGNWSLQRYIRLYENCVYVDGNLEITYLENGSYDLSFLSTIQEVKILLSPLGMPIKRVYIYMFFLYFKRLV